MAGFTGNITMKGKDALFAAAAECFITVDGRRYNAMNCINMEVTIKRNKIQVPILGNMMKGNKATTMEGTGKGTFHYNWSVMRALAKKYKDTGVDTYFEIQITNEDPTSNAGRQTIVLLDCNFDDLTLAKFDADGEYLDEELNFTFEDWKMPEEFALLDGML